MEKLYIALVDTPGFFANIIRHVIKISYCHVALSFDADFQEAYSVGRRDPAIPFFAGFIRENTPKILRVFPDARYRVCELSCTAEQKELLWEKMNACYEKRFRYHYCIIGLPFIWLQKPFYQKNHYTCSSFLAQAMDEVGLTLFDKHFSMVTPKDFYELEQLKVLYEGYLLDYVMSRHLFYRKGEVYGT